MIDEGESNDTVRLLLAGDPHLWENRMEPAREAKRIYDFGMEYGCDELILPGDIASSSYEMDDFLEDVFDDVFDEIRIAYGNNDFFEPSDVKSNLDIEVGSTVLWEEIVGEYMYSFTMKHDPARYKIRNGSCAGSNQNERTKDIIITGHNHMPESKVLNDGMLYINPGSVYSNYPDNNVTPDSSIFVVEVGEELRVRHFDYRNGTEIFDKTYLMDDEGFEEDYDLMEMSMKELRGMV